MEVKREKSIFRLLPRNSNFTWFLVTFALKNFLRHMECLDCKINDILCRSCWLNVCVYSFLFNERSEKTMNVAIKNVCFAMF